MSDTERDPGVADYEPGDAQAEAVSGTGSDRAGGGDPDSDRAAGADPGSDRVARADHGSGGVSADQGQSRRGAAGAQTAPDDDAPGRSITDPDQPDVEPNEPA